MECFDIANRPNSQLFGTCGICVDVESGNLFVGGDSFGRVLVFDKVGAYLRSIADIDTLHYPRGLCHHAGLLYIADSDNHRVTVYDSSSGELVRSIRVPDALSGSLNALVCNNVFR